MFCFFSLFQVSTTFVVRDNFRRFSFLKVTESSTNLDDEGEYLVLFKNNWFSNSV